MADKRVEVVVGRLSASEREHEVHVEVLRCNACGRMAVSMHDRRITDHKCAGGWTTILRESVPTGRIEAVLSGLHGE